MSTTRRFNSPAAAATTSLVLVLGALAVAPVSSAHAAEPPRFTLHVSSPRVTDDIITRVTPGMSQSDIEGLLGEPGDKERFSRSHTVAWDYGYRDTWGYDATFSVIFDDAGSVVSKVSVRTEG